MLDAGGGVGETAGPERLRRWLDGRRQLDKPALPERRGTPTIGDLPGEADAAGWSAAVRLRAASTWEACSALQPDARTWLAQAARN